MRNWYRKIDRKWINIINFALLTTFLVIGFVTRGTSYGGEKSSIPPAIFFTYQSNFFIWGWSLLEILKDVFKVNKFDKLINDNRHHISVTAWIGTTLFIPLFVLGPIYMSDLVKEGSIHYNPDTAIVMAENIILHFVTPTLFIMAYFKRKERQVVSYKHIATTFIWPFLWLIMILSYSIPTGIWPYWPTDPKHVEWYIIMLFFMACALFIGTNSWFLIWRTKKIG